MPINETLATYSDWLYTTAAAIYVRRADLHAGRAGLRRQGPARHRARRACRRASSPAAGGPPAEEVQAAQREAGRAERIGRMGVVAARARRAAAAVGDRAARARRAPRAVGQHVRVRHGGHASSTVVAWIVRDGEVPGPPPHRLRAAARRDPDVHRRHAAVHRPPRPVQPALQSYWLVIHVSAAIVGSGVFLVPGVASVLYLFRVGQRQEPGRGSPGSRPKLPDGRRARPDRLPHDDLRVPGVHLRRALRRGLGRVGLGPVLGLGPQGDRRVHRLGDLRGLPALPRDRGLARRPGRGDQRASASPRWSSTCSSSTWSRRACTRTPGWAERRRFADYRRRRGGD